ncbi:MAG: hypothetical protein HY062_12785 [Bacteroidetes bacterium]|nr:hypothetical protein [Bacteroidota bacterium]
MLTYITNKYFGVLCLLLVNISCFSQDTIFTAVPETLLVRVLEISSAEVSYKNFYNPDGIIRKIANDQVVRIVYENGKTESRFQLKQKTSGSVSPLQLFVVEGKHIALNNTDISHKAAFKIMLKKDSQSNSEELNEELVIADSKKNGQIAFNIAAPACAVAGIYLARQHRYNDPKERMKAKTYFLSGLSACVVSIVTAQIYKAVKNKHIRKAALLYNNDIL